MNTQTIYGTYENGQFTAAHPEVREPRAGDVILTRNEYRAFTGAMWMNITPLVEDAQKWWTAQVNCNYHDGFMSMEEAQDAAGPYPGRQTVADYELLERDYTETINDFAALAGRM